jgi:DNA-directed RNA polymerase subunit F
VSAGEVAELKTQLAKLDERAKRFEGMAVDYQKQLDNFKGIDPEKYKAIVEDYDNLRKQTAKTPEEITKLMSEKEVEIRSQYQKQQDELKSKYDSTSRELHELKVVDRALEQVGGIFNEDMLPFVKEQIRREIDRDAEGNFIVKGRDGKPAYSAKEPAKAKSISEWAAEMAERHPSMVRSTAKGGAFQKGETSNGAGSLDAKRYLDAVARGTTGDIPLAERGKMAMEVLNKTPFKL